MRARAVVFVGLFAAASAVDHAKFRTCEKTSFCRRHRKAEAARQFLIPPGSASVDSSGRVSAQLHGGPHGVPLTLELAGFESGAFRLRLTETKPLHGPRWEPDDILMDPPSAQLVALEASAAAVPEALRPSVASGEASVYALRRSDGSDGPGVVSLQLHPFRAALHVAGEPVVELNPEGKFYFEHHRAKGEGAAAAAVAPPDEADVHGGKTIVDYGEDGLAVYSDGTKQQRASEAEAEAAPAAEEGKAAGKEEEGLWEESFGSHRDSKPFGPASVGMDMRFGGTQHLFGLAEHTAPFNLPSTSGDGAKYAEPYRLWTLDVYDYELDSPMALYGGVPLLLAHAPNRTTGALSLSRSCCSHLLPLSHWLEAAAPSPLTLRGALPQARSGSTRPRRTSTSRACRPPPAPGSAGGRPPESAAPPPPTGCRRAASWTCFCCRGRRRRSCLRSTPR